jgi:hypothetical protein
MRAITSTIAAWFTFLGAESFKGGTDHDARFPWQRRRCRLALRPAELRPQPVVAGASRTRNGHGRRDQSIAGAFFTTSPRSCRRSSPGGAEKSVSSAAATPEIVHDSALMLRSFSPRE